MMLEKITKAQIKHIRLLQLKKFRQKYDQFIVEGVKSVKEFLNSSLNCTGVYGNEAILNTLLSEVERSKCFITNNKELEQISSFKTSQEILAVFEMPRLTKINTSVPFILALDDIRDPGNLGTIIRTAEWFGLTEIVCSKTTADCFNPKVIQASMGSLARMKLYYVDLVDFVAQTPSHRLVLADLKGGDYKNYVWTNNILLIGNEANGVSEIWKEFPSDTITILKKGPAESLNAAISTAILLANRF
jgi:TrmH family RNA methyltransferase